MCTPCPVLCPALHHRSLTPQCRLKVTGRNRPSVTLGWPSSHTVVSPRSRRPCNDMGLERPSAARGKAVRGRESNGHSGLTWCSMVSSHCGAGPRSGKDVRDHWVISQMRASEPPAQGDPVSQQQSWDLKQASRLPGRGAPLALVKESRSYSLWRLEVNRISYKNMFIKHTETLKKE